MKLEKNNRYFTVSLYAFLVIVEIVVDVTPLGLQIAVPGGFHDDV